jgi:hypothetical protein
MDPVPGLVAQPANKTALPANTNNFLRMLSSIGFCVWFEFIADILLRGDETGQYLVGIAPIATGYGTMTAGLHYLMKGNPKCQSWKLECERECGKCGGT